MQIVTLSPSPMSSCQPFWKAFYWALLIENGSELNPCDEIQHFHMTMTHASGSAKPAKPNKKYVGFRILNSACHLKEERVTY